MLMPWTQWTSWPQAVQLRTSLASSLEIALHPQQLKPEPLRVDGNRMIASTSSLRLVNELVGLRPLLGEGVDGVLEDLAFSASHEGKARTPRRPAGSL
jgi:hypothetical protein